MTDAIFSPRALRSDAVPRLPAAGGGSGQGAEEDGRQDRRACRVGEGTPRSRSLTFAIAIPS